MTTTLRLIPPAAAYRESYLAFVAELDNHDYFHQRNWPTEQDDFGQYVAALRRAGGWLWLVEGDEFIGQVLVLTNRLNFVQHPDGQVDYMIRPSKRRRGYGARLLALLKEHYRAQGQAYLLLSCVGENLASRRIILANGGRPYGAIPEIFSRNYVRLQYTIHLEAQMTTPEREQLFDAWAATYDESVTGDKFPFIGYDAVLETALSAMPVGRGARALDLGTGTGNLAAQLLARGGEVWGVDFSEAMLAQAREKVPGAHFVRANLLEGWPAALPETFNQIISAYVFHEFDLETKVRLIQELHPRLERYGRLVIADVAFLTVEDREAAHRRWAAWWDEDEHYWAADEAISALARVRIGAQYVQVSSCGGVFVIDGAKK